MQGRKTKVKKQSLPGEILAGFFTVYIYLFLVWPATLQKDIIYT